MRWEIKTSTKTEGDKKYTTRWKVQYITIGDIVMMGKSAAGAVVKLAQKLPEYIENYKKMRLQGIKDFINSENLANMVNSVVQPLSAIIQGMEVFKKIMNIVDSLTPIVKTVARASGVWCSPGNALDMAQIILSTVKQILIGIAVSAVIALKDWIWNFEFEIRRINLGTTVTVMDKLKKSFENDQKNSRILQANISANTEDLENSEFGLSPEGKKSVEEYKRNKELANKQIDDLFGDRGNAAIDSKALFESMFGEGLTDNDKCRQSDSKYITDFLVEGTTIYRMLAGSDEGKGIFYSDDGGKTWLPTAQMEHSFKKFAKITKDGKDIYVAGSIPYIKTLKRIPSEEQNFSSDEEGMYNKDYFFREDEEIIKYSKLDKETLLKDYDNNFAMIRNTATAMVSGEKEPAVGIFYSTDNGITWTPSNIDTGSCELFFEFPEKEGYGQTLVASSYDYQGIYYSEDGKTWTRPTDSGKEITTGRWIQYSPSKGLTPKFKNCNLDIEGKLKQTGNRIIVKVSGKEFKPIKMEVKALVGDGLDVSENMDLKIRAILKAIHETHPITADEKVVPEDIWIRIIMEIEQDKYQMSDGIEGKYLEEYIK